MRILVVDDHKIVRQAVSAQLKSLDREIDVQEADNGRAAVDMAATNTPDVVVMDLSMPVLDGIEATRQILENNPKIRVVALSAHSDRRLIWEMFEAGATAYVRKQSPFEELWAAIQTAVACRDPVNGEEADALVADTKRVSRHRAQAGVDDRITRREREVLQLIASGMSTKQIAGALKVSLKTVETHRRSTMEKLGLDNVADLTKYALREGLTSLSVDDS